MTTDEFNARYKLLKQIAEGKGRSFTAQEAATGRAVLVHFLSEDFITPGGRIADALNQLPVRDRAKVLEILQVDRSAVVVTQFLENLESFDLWLQGRLTGRPAPAPPPPETPAKAGEFTKLFEQGPGPDPIPVAPTPAPFPQAQPRDSFTDLFKTPPEPMTQPRPLSPSATPPLEILRVRLPASDSPPLQQPAPAPVLPKPSWPGSFDPPKAPNSLPPLPNPILAPRAAGPIIKPPSRDPLPLPVPVPGWSGESDYTRQLSPALPPVPAPAPAPPPLKGAASPPPSEAQDAPAGASRSIVPLLLVLNIVVIIATGIVLYFALKRS